MTANAPSAHLHLVNEAATLSLGADLARAMIELNLFPALLLQGALGAGKTTFVRGLVQALPGGDLAEVASPSFNYMNSYPTRPETSHFDLYRLRQQDLDDELLDAMQNTDTLVIVEWAEFYPQRHRPQAYLFFYFSLLPQGRDLSITAQGDDARLVLEHLRPNIQRRSAKILMPCSGVS
jgi:tRNA threonylcarbamoyladenosine biosynthesis protein TsaE